MNVEQIHNLFLSVDNFLVQTHLGLFYSITHWHNAKSIAMDLEGWEIELIVRNEDIKRIVDVLCGEQLPENKCIAILQSYYDLHLLNQNRGAMKL